MIWIAIAMRDGLVHRYNLHVEDGVERFESLNNLRPDQLSACGTICRRKDMPLV